MQRQDKDETLAEAAAERVVTAPENNKDKLITALVIVAFLVFGAFVVKTLSSRGPGGPARPAQAVLQGPPAGSPVNVAGVEWARADRTLLLVLSEGCHFCTDSADFYRRLAREAEKARDVRLVAVLPQDVATGRGYLDSLGVDLARVGEVRSAPLDTLNVPGTPTLILVDRAGTVVDSWVGQLPVEREDEVLDSLLGKRAA